MFRKIYTIIKYITPYSGYTLLNIVFNILSVIFSLVSLTMIIPFLGLLFGTIDLVYQTPSLSFNVNTIILNFQHYISQIILDHGKIDALLFICVLVVSMFFLKNLFLYLASYFLAPIRNRVVRDIRNDLYEKVLILPLAYYSEQKKGDILSRSINDVQEIDQSIMSTLQIFLREPITILFYLITLMVLSFKLTLFVLILLPLAGFFIGRLSRVLRKKSGEAQRQVGVLLSVVEETISGLRIIKGFNLIKWAGEKFKSMNKDYSRTMISIYRRGDLSSPMSEFLGAVVLATIMIFGGTLVLDAKEPLSAETFITYIVIFSQLINPAKSFSTAYSSVQKGMASIDRINEILTAEEVIIEKPNAISVKAFNESIQYKNVSFSYEKDTVLNNVNLLISKGKSVALVGPSGGGKSTMVDLLPRFYDCTQGDLLIDGVSIKDYRIDDVRGLVGIVPQEPILFNDTIFNNIAFGREGVTEEQVIEAAKIANAHEFIMTMDQGYYSRIGDRGGKLSGGQRQRISIARAVVKNPPILILDEATSSLDTESERLVQEALTRLMKNRTSVIIAHRLSTIQHVDEIVVIQKGEIVEQGTHEQLLSLNGLYKKLYDLQSFS